MQSHYDVPAGPNSSGDESDAGSSFARIGLLFGSLALALGLVLVPVYMKHSGSRLMDGQYAAPQSDAMTAVGAHE